MCLRCLVTLLIQLNHPTGKKEHSVEWRRNRYKTQNHTLEVIQVYFNKDSNLLLLLEDQ